MIQRIRNWRRAEQGMSGAALLILSLPLIIGVFGFGFDVLRLNYAHRFAQGRLDLATQDAAATTYTAEDGSIRLGSPNNPDEWREVAYNSYAGNTENKRGSGNTAYLLKCNTASVTGDELGGECSGVATIVRPESWPDDNPPIGFDFCNRVSTGDVYGVHYDVEETVPTVFMRILGINQFTFTASSEALIRQRNC